MRLGFFILLPVISFSCWSANFLERQQIEERIKPIGQVRLADLAAPEENIKPETSPSSASPTPDASGQAIYEQHCSICHRDGLAGAPKFRVAADWQPRLDKKNLDELIGSAIKGLNAMPMKGTCTECSEEDFKNVIQYMLPQS